MTREELISIYNQGPEAVELLVMTLLEQIAALKAQNQQLSGAVLDLQERVRELEARLHKDSHNSGKPPSSDNTHKRRHPHRKPGNRPVGGQPGHTGHTLETVECPNEVIFHEPEQCQECGHALADAPVVHTERRQVFDVPPMELRVTEHQALTKECPCCGHHSAGSFPEPVAARVQYGPLIKALSLYLLNYQLLPLERTHQLLEDLFGQPINVSTLWNTEQECAQALVPFEELVKRLIILTSVVNFDETSVYIAKVRQWMHTACTPSLTYYAVSTHRGTQAAKDIGILPVFTGTAVHDALSSYFTFSCSHSLCNAHSVRDLELMEEEYQQGWAADLKSLLIEIHDAVEQAKLKGASGLSQPMLHSFQSRYDSILDDGYVMQPPPQPPPKVKPRGRPKQSKPMNFLDRFRDRREEVLRFMYDFRVPFDNNQAERDLRMLKVQQKISGCFRTVHGAEAFCRIRGYISTARKQGLKVLQALESLVLGHPFVPAGESCVLPAAGS